MNRDEKTTNFWTVENERIIKNLNTNYHQIEANVPNIAWFLIFGQVAAIFHFPNATLLELRSPSSSCHYNHMSFMKYKLNR